MCTLSVCGFLSWFTGQAEERARQGLAISSRKKQTLEDLFRPPIDLMFKGSFHGVRIACGVCVHVCVCVCVCMRVWQSVPVHAFMIYVYAHACAFEFDHICVFVCTMMHSLCASLCVCLCVCVCMCMHAHACW